jgi:hypothetical protein
LYCGHPLGATRDENRADDGEGELGMVVFGFAFLLGLVDTLFRMLVKWQQGIDIRQYDTPHYNQFVAQEPILGAMLFVGGLILWFMPRGR